MRPGNVNCSERYIKSPGFVHLRHSLSQRQNQTATAFSERQRGFERPCNSMPREKGHFANFKDGQMLSGRIKKIIQDRGFGFIAAEGGDVFFHVSACKSHSGIPDPKLFEQLVVNDIVEFEIDLKHGNGPRAVVVMKKNINRCAICESSIAPPDVPLQVKSKMICKACSSEIRQLVAPNL